ncbi:hypothetical protein KJ644_03280 [Candidatus Dependentiae bacterium]|nr:hypothetical protein [Candidatus Dependentiae bacterium]MBU4387469.1 hypothetical protein [Candidatus Dependentiae bacterium]MCG2756150.1 hypothetical protein [Candidatus Dependentiae bacterium]
MIKSTKTKIIFSILFLFSTSPLISKACKIIIDNQTEDNFSLSFYKKSKLSGKELFIKRLKVKALGDNHFESAQDISKIEFTYLSGTNKNKKEIFNQPIKSKNGSANILEIKKEGKFTTMSLCEFYSLFIKNKLSKEVRIDFNLGKNKIQTITIPAKSKKGAFRNAKQIKSMTMYTRNIFTVWKPKIVHEKSFKIENFKKTLIVVDKEGISIKVKKVVKKDPKYSVANIYNKTDKKINVKIKSDKYHEINMKPDDTQAQIKFKHPKQKIKSIQVLAKNLDDKESVNDYKIKRFKPSMELKEQDDLEITIRSENERLSIVRPKQKHKYTSHTKDIIENK